ncbi:MAG: FprA family A-type flavoprotein, partial [Epulopiscium sp.]|nr:FprA family A-type flavoprotein [Candidatus Epulonipiscium sp.]
MQQPIQLVESIHWIGVNDRETHLFENLWPLENGVSYNSYLINDEKVALIDTVKITKMDEYIRKIKQLIGEGKTVDYLIINHMEPDHAGAIQVVVDHFPNIKLVGNTKTFEFVEGFFGITENLHVVNDGDIIDLGKCKLQFFMTPMVHWPETMMTYEQTNQVLFSGDAFGSFGTLDGGIFDDEVNLEFYVEEMRRYYSNIVGKFSLMVQRALKKLEGLDIKMIAATHGPIWRTDLARLLSYYQDWSQYKGEEGVAIVYGSMYGNTAKMADTIARALAEEGVQNIRVFDASKTHISHIINALWRFNGVVFGSCAYNAGIFPAMEAVLMKMEQTGLKNRSLGIFGSYSWSGGG